MNPTLGAHMTTYQYLIVGGGMAADAAARGIRDIDKEGSIAIFSADVDAPYPRPALSKKLWTDPEFTWDQTDLGTVTDTGAELRLGTEVLSIDRDAKTVLATSGQVFGYQKLLLVTGLTPSRIDDDGDAVLYFRSARDYQKLRALAQPGHRFVVVGGGYIGAELAAGLVQQGCKVSLVTPDPTLGGSQFPAQVASEYQKLFADAGVHLVTGKHVSSVSKHEVAEVTLDDGTILQADDVIAGLGASPVTNLAEEAGLTVDDGVVVDEQLRTSDPAIWAAGDIANYPDSVLGRIRVEHVDNATTMGKVAGRSMAGSEEPYTHTPMMYSQVFGVRWEAVGTLDSSLETTSVKVGDGQVVYYLSDGKPVGILLWNLPGRTDEAVTVLADPPEDLSTAIN
nr:FAD-dependent oxidoreductase [Cutibacterium modestum]